MVKIALKVVVGTVVVLTTLAVDDSGVKAVVTFKGRFVVFSEPIRNAVACIQEHGMSQCIQPLNGKKGGCRRRAHTIDRTTKRSHAGAMTRTNTRYAYAQICNTGKGGC